MIIISAVPATSISKILLQDETCKGLVVIQGRGSIEKRFRSWYSRLPCWLNSVPRFGSKLLFSVRYPASKNKFVATEMEILNCNYWTGLFWTLIACDIHTQGPLWNNFIAFNLQKLQLHMLFRWIYLQIARNLLKCVFFIFMLRLCPAFLKETDWHFIIHSNTELFQPSCWFLKWGNISLLIFLPSVATQKN